MNRFSHRAGVAAVAASVVFGAAAPAALAVPHGGPQGGPHGPGGGHGPTTKPTLPAKLAREVAHKDAALARVPRTLVRLDPAAAAQVAAHVAADRAALAGLTTWAEVRAVRPEVYAWSVNSLRRADRLQAAVGASADSTAQDQAGTALEAAVTQLLGLGATSSKGALAAAKASLRKAATLAEAAVALAATPDDPASDEPGEDSTDEDSSGENTADEGEVSDGSDSGDDSDEPVEDTGADSAKG
jgi:hypothetical protein